MARTSVTFRSRITYFDVLLVVLPQLAWDRRADIVQAMVEYSKVPDSYRLAVSPCLLGES